MKQTADQTCVVYCRTSTTKQKEAETIQAQVEACKTIVEREGLTVLKYRGSAMKKDGPKVRGWIIDDGVSGSMLEGREFRHHHRWRQEGGLAQPHGDPCDRPMAGVAPSITRRAVQSLPSGKEQDESFQSTDQSKYRR